MRPMKIAGRAFVVFCPRRRRDFTSSVRRHARHTITLLASIYMDDIHDDSKEATRGLGARRWGEKLIAIWRHCLGCLRRRANL